MGGLCRLAANLLQPPDVPQAGAALVHSTTALVAHGRALQRLAPVLDVVLLDDMTASP